MTYRGKLQFTTSAIDYYYRLQCLPFARTHCGVKHTLVRTGVHFSGSNPPRLANKLVVNVRLHKSV